MGKSVAIVGNGASGIQVVTEIAKLAKEVIMFQRYRLKAFITIFVAKRSYFDNKYNNRTPGWVLPKPNPQSGALWKSALRLIPGLHAFMRMTLYFVYEFLWNIMVDKSASSKAGH
jgi:hypothetical protein